MDYDALVIGSGIGGMESALKLGDMGYQVLVVEKEPSVGGKMILLSKVFPTLDCASCISTPKMAATAHHPNVTVLTDAEVAGITPRRRRPFPRDDPAEAPLRRRRRLHRLPALRAGVHRRRARPVQRRHGRAPRGVHRLPAGGAEEGRDRAGRHLAVHVQLPRRDQGPRLCLARPQRRVREGVQPRARDDAARRQPRPRLLRAVRRANARRGSLEGPLPIRRLKRFVADTHYADDGDPASEAAEPNGKRVAVVGSGPAGLTAAWQLPRRATA